jgi:hypothetical protein
MSTKCKDMPQIILCPVSWVQNILNPRPHLVIFSIFLYGKTCQQRNDLILPKRKANWRRRKKGRGEEKQVQAFSQ